MLRARRLRLAAADAATGLPLDHRHVLAAHLHGDGSLEALGPDVGAGGAVADRGAAQVLAQQLQRLLGRETILFVR